MGPDFLIADALFEDPLFKKGKKNVMEAVEKYVLQITEVRPPQAARVQSYKEAIAILENQRGGGIFYPYLGSGIGRGALVELADGSIKYDFISGIGVHFGHCHPRVLDATFNASVQNTVMQGHLMQNRDSLELTDLLIQHSGMDHCILSTSGAMANENALKLLFQKKYPATRLLAFEKCFMGRTLALSQITDRPAFRENLPNILHVDYLPFYDWQKPMESTERACSVLKTYLNRYPGEHVCLCAELIQGEAGSYPGKPEFFNAVFKILKENHVPIWVDEIQTFGRTDHLFCFHHFGLQNFVDIVTVSKLLQLSATLFKKEFRPKMGLISQTFTASTASIRAGIEIIKSLIDDGYLGPKGQNMRLRKLIVEQLQKLSTTYPQRIEGPFGYGLLIGFTVFKGDREKTVSFAKALFDAGMISYIAGANPTRMRLLIPAGGVTDVDIERAFLIFEETLANVHV